MGGLISIQTARDHGDRLAGVVLVDAPLRRPDPESQEGSRTRAFRAPRLYPTREEAVARFRLLPEQPVLHRFLFDHVAGYSVREVPGGLDLEVRPRGVRPARVFQWASGWPRRAAASPCSTGSTARSSRRTSPPTSPR